MRTAYAVIGAHYGDEGNRLVMKTPDIQLPDDAALKSMKDDLLSRGIIDKDGNLLSSEESRRISDMAKWAIVSEAMHRGKLK